MCGRIIQHSPSSAYAELFGIEEHLGETPPRYNLAPSQPILVARTAPGGKPELTYLRWGLVPSWSKGPARPRRGAGVPLEDGTAGGRAKSLDGRSPHRGSDPSGTAAGSPLRLSGLDTRFSLINARAETLDQKPAYRGPFRYRRCLIPTEGFYEWKPAQGGKQPYLIRMRSGAPFALAGLWDHWQDPNGSELETCTIIVTQANALIAPIHDRMPVVLPPEVWDIWLDPHQQDIRALRSILVPCASEPMEAFPVSRAVNNTRNDEPSLIEPLVGA
jgi:putative SOS response-associated peptidase YedK